MELRALGLSLNEVARVLMRDASALELALVTHETMLEARIRQLSETVQKVRHLRGEIGRGALSTASVLLRVCQTSDMISIAVDLPWPWGGERFELRNLPGLTYIVGPLGSGKTRLAIRLTEAIDGASFVGLYRLTDGAAAAKELLATDPQLSSRARRSITSITDDGGAESDALIALLAALEADDPTVHVVDMLEQGLDAPTQEALVSFLRSHGKAARPIVFLTRSSSILDIDSVGPDEAIILCPADHSTPIIVAPYRGAPGYEAVGHAWRHPQFASALMALLPSVGVRDQGASRTTAGKP